MNSANPFKVPTCFQRDFQQRRRERFRKSVVAAVAAVATLLVILLVQGCMSEHAKTSGNTVSPLEPTVASNDQVVDSDLKSQTPVSPLPPAPTDPAVNAASTAPAVTTQVVSSAPPVYVVKPGDTLSGIARLHQTTVKALKSVNGLESDRIFVGDTLKLPSA